MERQLFYKILAYGLLAILVFDLVRISFSMLNGSSLATFQIAHLKSIFMAFETTVTYKLRKDVQLCLSGMSESDIATIMSVVDASDMTPKVAFKD